MAISDKRLALNEASEFAVGPGHTIGDLEEVVARNERFEVVRKRGATEIAEFLDEEDPSKDVLAPA